MSCGSADAGPDDGRELGEGSLRDGRAPLDHLDLFCGLDEPLRPYDIVDHADTLWPGCFLDEPDGKPGTGRFDADGLPGKVRGRDEVLQDLDCAGAVQIDLRMVNGKLHPPQYGADPAKKGHAAVGLDETKEGKLVLQRVEDRVAAGRDAWIAGGVEDVLGCRKEDRVDSPVFHERREPGLVKAGGLESRGYHGQSPCSFNIAVPGELANW